MALPDRQVLQDRQDLLGLQESALLGPLDLRVRRDLLDRPGQGQPERPGLPVPLGHKDPRGPRE